MRAMRKFLLCIALAACVQQPSTQFPPAVGSSVSSVSSFRERDVSGTPDRGPRFAWPLDRADERMVKKIFGTFVTPENSPVQPERFSGYHTGIDFEVLAGESPHDIAVLAICDGPILRAQHVSGYGGVAVQRCALSGTHVTVLYGHLAADLLDVALDQKVRTGERIGVLGEGFGSETDGERPHLHLSVHRGEDIEWRGYVRDTQALGGWIDPAVLMRSSSGGA